MSKACVYIGWGVNATDPDSVVNCGEFTTLEAAIAAVAEAGLTLAEVETEFRDIPTTTKEKTIPQWRVESWHGGCGYRQGFYLTRYIDGKTQWLQNAKGRAIRFATAESARGHCAKLPN